MSLGISFYFQKFQSYGKAGWWISLLTPIKAERGTIHRDFSNSNIWLWKPELNMWNHTFTQNQLHAKKGLPMRSQKVRISCTHRRFFHPPSLKTTQKWSKYPQEYFLQNHFCICNFRDTEEEKLGENLLSYSPLVHKKLFLKEMCPSMFFDRWKNKSYKKKSTWVSISLVNQHCILVWRVKLQYREVRWVLPHHCKLTEQVRALRGYTGFKT